MKYNFDEIIERRGTNSVKWDGVKNIWGRDDLLPMWVADMDFRTPPFVMDALRKRLEHEVLGYTFACEEWYNSICTWLHDRHQWDISREMLTFVPGIVRGQAFALQCFTNPGDKVMVMTPVYHPFFLVTERMGREVVYSPLELQDGQYHINFEHFRKDLQGCKVLILCNPHNPGGRVDWFKGYSQTALNYVKQYRDSILSWVRDEEKKRLDELLDEVNFPAWQQKHGKRRETPRKQIDRFLHKNRYARQYTVAQHMQEVIWELAKSVYATKPSNAKFLSEVFGDSSRYAKRYSDLFRGPIQKEQLIHAAQAKRQLKHLPGGAQVPEWILKFIAENIHTEEACRDVKTARACLETWSADKKQRCPQIQREDLLPLIYTVCLQRAPAGEAKEMFLRLSEATLTACNMSRLDERFELDAVLLHYIEQDEVYWYGDICEEMGL